MENSRLSQNPENKIPENQNEIYENEKRVCGNWEEKRKRGNEMRTKSGKPLSKWHAARLRILEEEGDYGPFIQFIKWMGGTPPIEDFDDENEYLSDLRKEFESLGGYEFFKEHDLCMPPCGVSIDTTFFD